MTANAKPRYVSTSALAALCGVATSAVSNWITRTASQIDAPDAYLVNGNPLWTLDHARAIANRFHKNAEDRIAAIEAGFNKEQTS